MRKEASKQSPTARMKQAKSLTKAETAANQSKILHNLLVIVSSVAAAVA